MSVIRESWQSPRGHILTVFGRDIWCSQRTRILRDADDQVEIQVRPDGTEWGTLADGMTWPTTDAERERFIDMVDIELRP